MTTMFFKLLALLCIIFPVAEMMIHRPESTTELKLAILNASPGDTISLLPQTYYGDFSIFRSASKRNPITITGTREKNKETQIVAKRRGFDVKGDHWIIENLTIKSSDVGVELSGNHNLLKLLFINSANREIISEGEGNILVGISYANGGRTSSRSPIPVTPTTTEYISPGDSTTDVDCSGWKKFYTWCWNLG